MVTERSPPSLRSTLISTVPLPTPLVVRTCSQEPESEARHSHPSTVVTRTDARPPSNPTRTLSRSSSKRHGEGSWFTMTRASLTATPADRGRGCAFSATVIDTGPLPCPDAGLTVTHDASLAAVHAQSRVVDTFSGTVEPEAGIADGGEIRVIWHRSAVGPMICSVVVPPQAAIAASAMPERNRRAARLSMVPGGCIFPARAHRRDARDESTAHPL